MASLNKVQLIGYMGGDPEVRQGSAKEFATFSVATTEKWLDHDGRENEHTEWHNITVFDRLCETCCAYGKKGKQVYVEGKIKTNDWVDEDGNKRKSRNIVAKQVLFLGSKGVENGDTVNQ